MPGGRTQFAAAAIFFLAALTAATNASAHENSDILSPEASRSILLDQAQALQYSQDAIGRVVGDYRFLTMRGEPFSLARLRGKPVVVNLIYTSCNDVCPLTIQTLARAADAAWQAVGRDSFRVVTIGFDSRSDTPQRMRDFASAHGIDAANWEFLSADAATVERLTRDVGFLYAPTAAGFDHLAQTTLIDAEGKVARQIYGTDFPTQALVEPLKQLVWGGEPAPTSFAGLVNRIKLICTVFDPASGRYRFSYAIFIELIVGGASLASLGFIILRLWLQARRSMPSQRRS